MRCLTSRRALALMQLVALGLAPVAGLLAAEKPGAPAPLPPRMLLLDGALVGPAVVAVGERGTVLLSTDDAATWQRIPVPTRVALTGVSFATPPPPQPARRGWAVGHEAIILVSEDAGRTWARQYQGENPQDSFLDVVALDEQRAIAVGAYGLYAATTDGGKTWAKRKIRAEDSHFNRISRGPTGTLYLAGEAGTLLRSSDQGTTWTPLRAPYEGSFYGVLALDRRTLLAYGLRGHIFRSTDDGATWEEIRSPATGLLAAGLQLQSNHLLLAGQARALVVSRDYGKTFAPVANAPATGIAEMIELPSRRFLVLGEAGATVSPLP